MTAFTGPHGNGWRPLIGQPLPAWPPAGTVLGPNETGADGSSLVNTLFTLGTVAAALVLVWTIASTAGSGRD